MSIRLRMSRGWRLLIRIAWGLLAACIALLAFVFWRNPEAAPPEKIAGTAGQRQVLLEVPYLNQMEKYPTGCESVCAVMALRYAGIPITVEEYIDHYLEQGAAPARARDGKWYGCDPRDAFPGSPYSDGGWGCYAPVIAKGMEKLVKGTAYCVSECRGKSLQQLCRDYLDKGFPVLVWASQYMEPVREDLTFLIPDTGEEFQWLTPMHCALLVGYDENYYYFNDPMTKKNQEYARSSVEEAYAAMGQQAVVLTKPEANALESGFAFQGVHSFLFF